MISIIVKLLPAIVVYAWFVQKASWFWNHNEELAFGWVVLLLSIYVLYEKVELLGKNKVNFESNWVLKFFSLILFISGIFVLFQFQIYVASLGMKAAALMGFTFGVYLVIFSNILYQFGWSGIRQLSFGFLFIVIALPMPSLIQGIVINGLQNIVSTVTVEVLNLIGTPAKQIGSLIELPSGTVGVDEACSGIRSLQSTVMATLFIGYLCLKNLGTKIFLFVAGVVLAMVGNLIRAVYLSHVANTRGIEAVDEIHDSAGYSILIFTVIGVSALAWGITRAEKILKETDATEAID